MRIRYSRKQCLEINTNYLFFRFLRLTYCNMNMEQDFAKQELENKSCVGRVYFADSRSMNELQDNEVDLIVTSPPYWSIKDYGSEEQIGYGQSLHDYLKDLYLVFSECYRVLRSGARLCVNIGDQFIRASEYGRYKIIPIHSEIIRECEMIGFDYMGAIIWQKKTTMNPTGGANVMGSFPYPPNGIVEIDYEFILIFKKPGAYKKVSKDIKESSRLTKEEWKEYFSGHWRFGGTKQKEHQAMFPEELPRRLIKMFSYEGDTVLDPFLGSGTTLKVALELNRKAIGYEINKNFKSIIENRINNILKDTIQFIERDNKIKLPHSKYVPMIKNFISQTQKEKSNKKNETYKVLRILDNCALELETGLIVELIGVIIKDKEAAKQYLNKYVLGKRVKIKNREHGCGNDKISKTQVSAYVYLKNGMFVNAYLVKLGIAENSTLEGSSETIQTASQANP